MGAIGYDWFFFWFEFWGLDQCPGCFFPSIFLFIFSYFPSGTGSGPFLLPPICFPPPTPSLPFFIMFESRSSMSHGVMSGSLER
jgi:hypothetical protein